METIVKKINLDDLKRVLIYTFILGIVAHGYCFFNSNFSHDSLCHLYVDSSEEMISIGRYIRPLYRCVRGNFTLPTLIGFLSLLFFGTATYFILDSLNLKSRLFRFIATGLLVTNFSVSTLNATFVHDADSYAFTLLIVSFGLWLSIKKDSFFVPLILFTTSLGIYQAYINVAIIIYLIQAFENLIKNSDWKSVILLLAKRLMLIFLAMVLYYIGYILVVKITGVPMGNAYNSPSNAANISFYSIIERIRSVFSSEKYWFCNPLGYSRQLVMIINVTLTVILVLLVLMFYKRNLKLFNILLSIVVILVMPFGINVITFVSNMYHDLTIYSLSMFYIIILKDLELLEKNKIYALFEKITIISMLLIICNNCIYSNELYLKKDLEYDATLSTFTRIVDRIEQVDGYVPGYTEVAIIGSLNNSLINKGREGYPTGTGVGGSFSVTYYSTYIKYFNDVLGYNINLLDAYESDEISDNQIIKEMPSFPNKECTKLIDNVVVVKLSE